MKRSFDSADHSSIVVGKFGKGTEDLIPFSFARREIVSILFGS